MDRLETRFYRELIKGFRTEYLNLFFRGFISYPGWGENLIQNPTVTKRIFYSGKNKSFRKPDRKGRAFIVGLDLNVPAVGNDDLVDYRKAQACAALLGGIEREEYLVPDAFGNTMACVRNGYA